VVATALDVVILTVIPCELQAALNTLALSIRWTDDTGTVYYRGTVHSALSGRALQVAATCIGNAGNSAAAAAVCNAIAQWQPQAVLLVGIAAGLRDRLRLGSVVLSDRVIAYEHATVIDRSNSSHQQPRPEGTRLPHAMAQQLASYEPKSARLTERFVRAGGQFPSVGSDESDKVATSIQVTRATIASGNKLLRDAQKLEEIRGLHGKIEAFDMESAGLVEACDRDHVPWLVIRGISDFGDAQKDDRFQDFAARSATAVLADFLAHGWDLPPANPHRTSQRLSPTLQIPKYGDERTRILSEQLQDARRRRITLANAGAKTDKLDEEILELKRKMREGGQLRPGDTLGERYLLLEPIGRGGFATVWKALDETTKNHVAIKVLHTEIAGDVVRRDRFYRGARTMSMFEHSSVVRVLEPHGDDGGYCYFVMEYVAGGDLRRAVLDGKLDKPSSLALLLPIGEALAEAHARGIVHRDVKPANILLDENNQPKLTDFDLVAVADTTGGTRTGALGTFVYAAPECLHHPQDADSRADVYGLGMTALFCLHEAELPMDVIRGMPPFLDDIDCAGPIRGVLEEATAWKRDQRTANASVFIDALRKTIPQNETVVATASGPTHDILAWISDGERDETLWLTEDGNGVRVVARVPRLVLGAANQVWVGRRKKRTILLFAPETLGEHWERNQRGDSRRDDFATVEQQLNDVELEHATSGQMIWLGAFGIAHHTQAFEFSSSLRVLSSVGRYLPLATHIQADYGGAHPFGSAFFHVLDLETGNTVDMLTPEDRARLTDALAPAALRQIREEFDALEEDATPTLTMFDLSYSKQKEPRLQASYQLTFGTYYVASDRRWGSYTRSTSVWSDDLPIALEPYRIAPPLLTRYWSEAPRLGKASGWTAVSRSRETRAILRQVFEQPNSHSRIQPLR